MEWIAYADEIREVLDLEGNAVSITYSMKPPSAAASNKLRACDALPLARDGQVIDITASTHPCVGGSWYLGLGERPKGKDDKGLLPFTTEGKKLDSLYCTYVVCRRAVEMITQPPTGWAEHIILSPLNKAEFQPDIVLFICNPEQSCRLVTLDGYERGIPPRIEMFASTCHQAIGYPIVSGELNVSLMDYSSRSIRGIRSEDLLVSIPYHRFLGIMRSISYTKAGRNKSKISLDKNNNSF